MPPSNEASSTFQKKINYFNVKHRGQNISFPEQGTWHWERKKKILEKYPQIKNLFRPDPTTMFYLVPLWTFHVFMSYYTAQWSWYVKNA